MTVDNQSISGRAFMLGSVIGGVVGALAALLMAPKSGRQTQDEIKSRAQQLRDEADRALTEGRQTLQEEARGRVSDSLRRTALTLHGWARQVRRLGDEAPTPALEAPVAAKPVKASAPAAPAARPAAKSAPRKTAARTK